MMDKFIVRRFMSVVFLVACTSAQAEELSFRCHTEIEEVPGVARMPSSEITILIDLTTKKMKYELYDDFVVLSANEYWIIFGSVYGGDIGRINMRTKFLELVLASPREHSSNTTISGPCRSQ